MSIASGLSEHRWYAHWSIKEDLAAAGAAKLSQVWSNFDETKTDNPFGYYTRICQNVFLELVGDERKQADILDEAHLGAGVEPSSGYEDRQTKSGCWARERAHLQEQRAKDLAKAKVRALRPEPNIGTLAHRPVRPKSFVFELTKEQLHELELGLITEDSLVQAAHDACTAVNLAPETITWRGPNGVNIGETDFDVTRRRVSSKVQVRQVLVQ